MSSAALEEEWDRIVSPLRTERIDALLEPMAQPVDLRDLFPAALVGIHPKSLYRMVTQGRVQPYGSRGFRKVFLAELLKPVETGAEEIGERGAREIRTRRRKAGVEARKTRYHALQRARPPATRVFFLARASPDTVRSTASIPPNGWRV
jgi:hypothetical protein